MTPMKMIALTDLSAKLAEATGEPPINYRVIWNAAVSAKIPTIKGPNGRRQASEIDLPVIAAAFGMEVKAQAVEAPTPPDTARRRKVAPHQVAA